MSTSVRSCRCTWLWAACLALPAATVLGQQAVYAVKLLTPEAALTATLAAETLAGIGVSGAPGARPTTLAPWPA